MDGVSPRRIERVTATSRGVTEDQVVVESPIEFRLGEIPIAVVMRTPGHDAELGLGFAITEGIVLGPHEVEAVVATSAAADGDRWTIELAEGVAVDPEQFRRNLYTTSSCGVCGKASIDAIRIAAPRPPSGPIISVGTLERLPAVMRAAQPAFDETGGLHAAALFDRAGELEAIREDIGRHNAVDKLVGAVARHRWPLGECVLVVSGRISFEIVQKAAVAGIPFVCGVSAASSLAADLGDELGLTIVGFLRDQSFNVYSGGHRIV